MTEKNVKIDDSWYAKLEEEFNKDYFKNLKDFLVEEKAKYRVYPPGSQTFTAFNLTPFDKVKVVVLGQDPYHGPVQAHGLSFSVPNGIKIPPSLLNIYKELKQDIGFEIPTHGYLEDWAKQGVFLINATLSVRAHSAGSHQKKGWETFTDKVISTLSEERENIVFLLWGNYARAKKVLIDESKHLILEAAHPSPLSAYNGFFGCKHFSATNEYLESKGVEPIKWQLLNNLDPQLF
ncbi:MAG: uracil-DNA glycosylase [Marinilabiliales bacterium]|nr:MAG: uracil-DNA glycosylase [Marinilabiliales bacterium]